ncbi:hypothetical protein C1H76_9093 [Elsinoe australis]|uniref:Rhodopsin domain-containing protein n=1 Tax=Elsinoe australis TaxID=40998 RepID=A0A4V6DT10_9PEZI|nr:hypothetical protein C1H76_9093 [Elsinoe australis]
MSFPSRAPEILIGNFVPFFVACPVVLARFWSRAVILKVFHIEDYILLISWIAALGVCINSTQTTKYGSGRHQKDIPFETISSFFKTLYADRLMYQFSISMTKISLCLMYLRIFGTFRPDRIFLWATNSLLAATMIALIFYDIFQCNPISKVWDITMQTGHCVSDEPGFWTSFIISLVIDIALLVFSGIKVWGLQMVKRQRVIMLATVGIGWLVVVAALVRGIRIAGVLHNSDDASWRTYDTSIWSAVEINVALLCTAAPAVKPLVKQLAPRLLGALSSSNKGGTSTYQRSGTTRPSQLRTTTKNMTVNETELDDRDGKNIVKLTKVTVDSSARDDVESLLPHRPEPVHHEDV